MVQWQWTEVGYLPGYPGDCSVIDPSAPRGSTVRSSWHPEETMAKTARNIGTNIKTKLRPIFSHYCVNPSYSICKVRDLMMSGVRKLSSGNE